jgi:hypothetical protein
MECLTGGKIIRTMQDIKVRLDNGFPSDSPCKNFDRVALVSSLVVVGHCAVWHSREPQFAVRERKPIALECR